VVALDVGSSSVRAFLFDVQMKAVPGAEVRHRLEPLIRSDGTAELDPEALVRLVARCLSDLLRRAGPERSRRIACVGVSTFWHGLVAADDSARPLTPLYLWADSRSRKVIAQIEARLDAEQIRQRTGCPIHPSYWPAKLAWLRRERPDLWKRPVKWLSFGDLLYWRWFGRLGTSLSMASGTGLLRLADCRWDDELMTYLGVRGDSLPPIAQMEQGLVAEYRRRLPELAEVPWVHAVGDGALANLGSGCLSPVQRALTVGTSGALRVMHPTPGPALPPGLWTYRLDRDRMVTGGALSNGGNLRQWLGDVLRSPLDGLDDRLRRMRPAAHGLTFLPHLAGERSPGFAAHAFGAVAGLTSATTADDITRAGLEAVAIEFASVDRRLDLVFPRAKRLVAGGAALLSSPAWMQMMADATGRPVAQGRAVEASSHGAALFAIESLGLGDPAKLQPPLGPVLRPVPSATRAYRRAALHQEALYRALIIDRVAGDARR
jgi:gluconokinase